MISGREVHGRTADGSASWMLRWPAILSALVFALAAPGASFGQTIWQVGTGNWNTPGNWTLGVPNSASGTTFDAQIINNGTAQLLAPGASVRRLRVGVNAGGGHLEVNGGGLTVTDDLILNFQGTSTASTTVQNGGIVTVPATIVGDSGTGQSNFLITGAGSRVNAATSFVVGRAASGTLTLANGGTLAVVNLSAIGNASNGSGFATVSGPGTTWTTHDLTVGFNGTAELEILSGGTVTSVNKSVIGELASSFGAATVRGAGSRWNVGDDLLVGGDGVSGYGTLNIEDQAIVHIEDILVISPQSIVNLSGGTLRYNGTDQSGTFNFNSGTIQLSGNRSVGIDSAIEDRFGAAPIIPVGKGLTVEGTATLLTTVTLDGGTFSVAQLVNGQHLQLQRGTFNLANQAVTIAPGGLLGNTLDLAHDMTVNITLGISNQGLVTGDGQLGGTFTNAAAGELRAEPGRSLKLTGTNNTNAGQISLYGGMLEFTQNLTNNAGAFISGNGTLKAATGLTNHGTMNFAGTTNLVGNVTNSATGKIISGGGGATIFYDDVTNQGEIRTSAGSFTVFFGAVAGAGTFTGLGTVNFEGDLKPGNSPAAVQFAGDVAFGSGATLQIELGGSVLGTQYDHVRVAGDLSLDGSLIVSLINNFQPTIGQSFNILDWIGTRTGTFSSLTLPTLAGLAWNTSQLYATGVLSLTAAGLPGDYNQNGTVDAADYTVWRNNLGSGTSLANDDTAGVAADDYTRWKTNFGAMSPGIGAGSGSGASANAAVPEPATAGLLLVGMLAMWCGRFGLEPRSRR